MSGRGHAAPRVIAFEGVDGAGKSTVLALVADHLRRSGHEVFLPRAGKEHAARVPRAIRRLTRDPRNMGMAPEAELALYCAREAQVLHELVRPALARGETVLLDRSLLTHVVLGAFGRGLDRATCESMAVAASGGLDPDLTLVFDVDPRTSRMRKRIGKVRSGALRDRGRKGLSGSGLKERVRDGYASLASAHGFPVFHAERTTPEQLAERVITVLEGAPAESPERDARPWWRIDPALSLEAGLDAVPTEVAIYLSRGLRVGRAVRARALEDDPILTAWAMDPDDPMLERAAELAPEQALPCLAGRPIRARDLRLRLANAAPTAALRGLVGVSGSEADALRRSLAQRTPGAVVESLSGREDTLAAALRDELWDDADPYEQAASLAGCSGAPAHALRERLLESHTFLGVESLAGADPMLADPWLRRHADAAPRCVLRALVGRTDETADELRQSLVEAGRECLDSIIGLDHAGAWTMREQLAERWPSSVVHSLLGLADSPRRRALIERCTAAAPDDLHLLRRVRELDEHDAKHDA